MSDILNLFPEYAKSVTKGKAIQGNLPELSSDSRMKRFDYKEVSNLLPFAADHYKISSNIADYILVPTEIVLSDIPNRNGVSFPLEELTRFDEELGNLAYKSWQSKPTYLEHKHDRNNIKGMVFDVSLSKATNLQGEFAIVSCLLGFDRTKDSVLAQGILDTDEHSYSMGAYTRGGYECAICEEILDNKKTSCAHCDISTPYSKARIKVIEVSGVKRLSYLKMRNIQGFEVSRVNIGAFDRARSTINWS
jgi:hypothetical protein